MGNEHFIIEGILLDEKHSYTLVELEEIWVEHQDNY